MVRRFLARLLIVIGLLLSSAPVLTRADSLPERATINAIKGHRQSYALSCESRSAVDWAAFHGVRIGEKKFQSQLPRSDNPDVGFVGNPNHLWGNVPPASYGVHAEPVAALLREYGLQAEAIRGLSWNELRAEIAAGRPVIVWVIGEMWKGNPVNYRTSNGDKTTVAPFEHTMILVGYAPKSVTMIDAYTGRRQNYPLRTFLDSWKTLGRMAIVGNGGVDERMDNNPPQGDGFPILHTGSPSVYLPVVLREDIQNQDGQISPDPQRKIRTRR